MSKIIVGMTGGVDSAVAAYLLKKEGHEVVGVTLRTWNSDGMEESRCCEIDDARRIAGIIGIPYYAPNCISAFDRYVTEPFVKSYICGETPNPCVECNRFVKWDGMLHFAKVLGADQIATGHYAFVEKLQNGRYAARKGLNEKKDQSYMLYKLTQEQLSHTLMPLGALSKDEVRQIAFSAGLPVASKKDSQEICFVTEGKYFDYLKKFSDTSSSFEEGNFVDENGNILGTHKGIVRYTVGQRKGLGIALGRPMFVKEINAEKNEVVLSEENSLYTKVVFCEKNNFQSIPTLEKGQSISAFTKIRYHHFAQESVVEALEENILKITFSQPVRAAAPGQSAVFYDENGCVIGGGIIRKQSQ